MIESNHPFYFLTDLYKKENAIFHLSKYVYVPDSLLDEREYIRAPASELTPDWINNQIDSLGSDQELALHSNILIKNRTFHIPMIDFSYQDPLTGDVFDRIGYFLPRSIMLNLAVYESGRSYHAYSRHLIAPKNWIEFMGRLLLINQKNKLNLVDTRWVGHRLVGGYSSLRWSNNTDQYKGMPRRVSFPM